MREGEAGRRGEDYRRLAGFSRVKPWLPVPRGHVELAVDAQEGDAESTLALARRVIGLRREEPALRWGGMRVVEASESLLIFERRWEGERVVGVFNLGREARGFEVPGMGRCRVLRAVGGATLGGLPGLSGVVAKLG